MPTVIRAAFGTVPNRYRPIDHGGCQFYRCATRLSWGAAKAAWTALRNATEAELPRHWGDWAQIRDLARLIEFVTELELLDIIRHHAESFRLYRGQNCSCDSRQPPWYVMSMPLACEKSQR